MAGWPAYEEALQELCCVARRAAIRRGPGTVGRRALPCMLHAAYRGAEYAVSSRGKRQLTKATLRAVGATQGLVAHRVAPNGHPRLAAEFATPMSVQHLGVQYPPLLALFVRFRGKADALDFSES
jgi:hypothetical protein